MSQPEGEIETDPQENSATTRAHVKQTPVRPRKRSLSHLGPKSPENRNRVPVSAPNVSVPSASSISSTDAAPNKGRLVAKLGNIHIWGTNAMDGIRHSGTNVSGSNIQRQKGLPLGYSSRSKSRSLGVAGWQRQMLKRNFSSTNLTDLHPERNINVNTTLLRSSPFSASSINMLDKSSSNLDCDGPAEGKVEGIKKADCNLNDAHRLHGTLKTPQPGRRAGYSENKRNEKTTQTISSNSGEMEAERIDSVFSDKSNQLIETAMEQNSNHNLGGQHDFFTANASRSTFATAALRQDVSSRESPYLVKEHANQILGLGDEVQDASHHGIPSRATFNEREDFKESSDVLDKAPWEKILWKRQPYPDNFVHHTFCDSVRDTHDDEEAFDYWTMVRHTAVLMQQLCVVVIFSTVFRLALIEDVQSEPRPDTPSISLRTLLHIDAAVIVLLYAMYAVFSKKVPPAPESQPHMLSEPQRLLLFLVVLMAVSPVLHTLTKTYASDTIYLLAVLLGALHLFSYDFTYMLTMRREFKGTVSMNAALLCSILLASRLSSNLHCFGLMCFAVELFSLSPILWHMLRVYSAKVHAAVTAMVVIAVSVLLAFTNRRVFGFLFIFAAIVIPFIAPLVFIRVQRFKVRIAGPWDLGGVKQSAGT